MDQPADVVIVGAGASGLLAAQTLAQAGKRVLILEARDRIGGRIMPLGNNLYGYPADGGAEFVHGKAPITHALLQKAGLTYCSVTDGAYWEAYGGKLTDEPAEIPYYALLEKRLLELDTDMPVAAFFDRYFPAASYPEIRPFVYRIVEGYDAADPARSSTFTLREELLGDEPILQGRIKEGYGALLDYLLTECTAAGVRILSRRVVSENTTTDTVVTISCDTGESFRANTAIVTVPLPIIQQIKFFPPLPGVSAAASKIGYGSALKIILRFQTPFWEAATQDMGTLAFLFSDTATWWTQYPATVPVLTAFIAGPSVTKFNALPHHEIVASALSDLATMFHKDEAALTRQCSATTVLNWSHDIFAAGAYSYPTPETNEAVALLKKPHNHIFFAGEALAGETMATVEGAFASGLAVAKQILL